MDNGHNNEQPTSDRPAQRWPMSLHQKSAWLAILVVITILGLIAFFGLRTPTNTNGLHEQASVNINNTGFFPAEITINRGTQVTWTNLDSKSHQVAADPYPKNNSIPGFNNLALLQTNDTYSFVFSKAGTYHYHDQLNPFTLLGTVVVK